MTHRCPVHRIPRNLTPPQRRFGTDYPRVHLAAGSMHLIRIHVCQDGSNFADRTWPRHMRLPTLPLHCLFENVQGMLSLYTKVRQCLISRVRERLYGWEQDFKIDACAYMGVFAMSSMPISRHFFGVRESKEVSPFEVWVGGLRDCC